MVFTVLKVETCRWLRCPHPIAPACFHSGSVGTAQTPLEGTYRIWLRGSGSIWQEHVSKHGTDQSTPSS